MKWVICQAKELLDQTLKKKMFRRGQRHRSPWLCGWNPHWHAEWDGERATLKLPQNCFEARNFPEMKLCYCKLWKFNIAKTLKAYSVVIQWFCCMKLAGFLHVKTFKKGKYILQLGFHNFDIKPTLTANIWEWYHWKANISFHIKITFHNKNLMIFSYKASHRMIYTHTIAKPWNVCHHHYSNHFSTSRSDLLGHL